MKPEVILKTDTYIPPSAWWHFRHKPYEDLKIRKGGDTGGEEHPGAVLSSAGGDQRPAEADRPGGEVPKGDGGERVPGI